MSERKTTMVRIDNTLLAIIRELAQKQQRSLKVVLENLLKRALRIK